jgi:hypothetical protein
VCQYAPVIETIREGQDSSELFLAEDPLILLSEGRFNKVPVITGLMEDEGLLFHAAGWLVLSMLINNNCVRCTL